MGNFFDTPKPEPPPKEKEAVPMPIRDDVAERMEKAKVAGEAARRGGSRSTQLSKSGDLGSVAPTRTSTIPGSRVLGAG